MTKAQSLKNFIRLLDKEFIFFEFGSETEFTVQFLGPQFDPFNPELAIEMDKCKLPYACLFYDVYENEMLHYSDENGCYYYNLSSDKLQEYSGWDIHRMINQTPAERLIRVKINSQRRVKYS